MNTLRFLFVVVTAVVLSHQAFAQFGDCLYQHELDQPTELIHEVKLPPSAFAKTDGDRYNFRVYGVAASGDTLEMPWAYPWLSQRTSPLALKQLNAGKTAAGYRFTYESSSVEPIQSLYLELGNTDFEGLVKLEGADKLGDWQTVLKGYRIIDLSSNGGPYRFTTLKFRSSVYRYYRITIAGVEDVKLEQVEQGGQTVLKIDTLNFLGQLRAVDKESEIPKTSMHEYRLSDEVLIDHLTLSFADTLRYVRQVEIQVLQDSFKRGEEMKFSYKTIARSSVSSLDPGQPIGFEPVVAHQLRVLIRNQDNQPLTLLGMEAGVKEPRVNVRFSGAEKYFLAYGCESLRRPNYDISQELSAMKERPSTLAFAPLNSFVVQDPIDSVEGMFSNSLWLYGALAIVAGLLGWMAIGMMKK
ncbi:MAG: DUF3999 family protein [Saprospiraceae bacterium]